MSFFLKFIGVVFILFTPQMARADMNLIDRVLFSDKGYAKEIEISAYIITQEQACAALSEPPKQPVQLGNKDLYGKKLLCFCK